MMGSRSILIGMALAAVSLAAVWAIGCGEPPRGAKVQAGGPEPTRLTGTADNEVLSGDVAVSPRISLFVRALDENCNLTWEGWLENGRTYSFDGPVANLADCQLPEAVEHFL
jgi:hypothetical protein